MSSLVRMAKLLPAIYGEYRSYKEPLNTGYTFPEWYEFVEYGTWDLFQIKLQKNGFSREVASYIARNLGTYTVMVGKQRLLKRSLFNCPNASARRE